VRALKSPEQVERGGADGVLRRPIQEDIVAELELYAAVRAQIGRIVGSAVDPAQIGGVKEDPHEVSGWRCCVAHQRTRGELAPAPGDLT
jgi:hypothetical protein